MSADQGHPSLASSREPSASAMTRPAGNSPTPPSLPTVLTLALFFGLVPGVLEPVGLVSGVSAVAEGHRSVGTYLLWMPAAANLICFAVQVTRHFGDRLLGNLRAIRVLIGAAAVALMVIAVTIEAHRWRTEARMLAALPPARS